MTKRRTAGSFPAVPAVQEQAAGRNASATCGPALASASFEATARSPPVHLRGRVTVRDCGSEETDGVGRWCVAHWICELRRNHGSSTEGRRPRSSNPPLRLDARLQPPHPPAVTIVTKIRYATLSGNGQPPPLHRPFPSTRQPSSASSSVAEPGKGRQRRKKCSQHPAEVSGYQGRQSH